MQCSPLLHCRPAVVANYFAGPHTTRTCAAIGNVRRQLAPVKRSGNVTIRTHYLTQRTDPSLAHRRGVLAQHHPLDLRHLCARRRHRPRHGAGRRRQLVLHHRRLRLRPSARGRHLGGGRGQWRPGPGAGCPSARPGRTPARRRASPAARPSLGPRASRRSRACRRAPLRSAVHVAISSSALAKRSSRRLASSRSSSGA